VLFVENHQCVERGEAEPWEGAVVVELIEPAQLPAVT
jgi:hypothetical protein